MDETAIQLRLDQELNLGPGWKARLLPLSQAPIPFYKLDNMLDWCDYQNIDLICHTIWNVVSGEENLDNKDTYYIIIYILTDVLHKDNVNCYLLSLRHLIQRKFIIFEKYVLCSYLLHRARGLKSNWKIWS